MPFLLIAIVLGVLSLICWLIILIDAFQDEIWKGVVGLLCWIYLFFALFEFDHPNKWVVVIG